MLRLRRLGAPAEQRCAFCGASAQTVALVAGRQSAQAVICATCVRRAALQLGGPGPGDAA
ncbi:MAG: hypothetical protein ACREN4_02170 [Candidatus Dormibacteria bacterium]